MGRGVAKIFHSLDRCCNILSIVVEAPRVNVGLRFYSSVVLDFSLFGAISNAAALSPGDISLITVNVIRMSIVSCCAAKMKYSARNWMKC